MHIHIIAVGETRQKYLLEGETEYLKRLGHYCKIEVKSVRGEKIKPNHSVELIKKVEGDRLKQNIPQRGYIIALDKQGKQLNSEQLADTISDWQNQSYHHVSFLIGGPLGLSESILSRADLIFSLSKMTFTHEMVRLILLEQIYRGFTILRGEKYHK
jgi:23S rRNA (pseudouridine1915-N3)-methyltransferase